MSEEEHPGTVTACRITVEEEEVPFYVRELRYIFEQLSLRNANTIYGRVADAEDAPTRYNQTKVEILDFVRLRAVQSGIPLDEIPLPP
jgi:hypothetical protein